MRSGIFRYIVYGEVSAREKQGWIYVCPLWQHSCLMWWCCGACRDDGSEVPK